MASDIDKALFQLALRRSDPDHIVERGYTHDLIKSASGMSTPSKVREYIKNAMAPIPEKYTTKTLEEAAQIVRCVQKEIASHFLSVDFENQGSVTNRTAIKFHSDIDILVIRNDYFFMDPPPKPVSQHFSEYEGDPASDMQQLKSICQQAPSKWYPRVRSTSGPKAVAISGYPFKRKLDLVPCCYYHPDKPEKTRDKLYRGIHLFDTQKRDWIVNFPFMHNHLIIQKDNNSGGNYSKLVRALKSIKADADVDIKCSSYDIASLVYHIKNKSLMIGDVSEVLLLKQFVVWLDSHMAHNTIANLRVPNDTRPIISEEGGANLTGVRMLVNEVRGRLAPVALSSAA